MSHLKTFGRFWYDFVVGDDWHIAVGVLVTVVIVDIGVRHGLNLWWLLPLAATALLTVSVMSVSRQAAGEADSPAADGGAAS